MVEAAFFFPPIIKTAIAELTTIIIAVVCRIFPIPTKGETIPPARKLTAPNTADAAPAFCRSESNAKAVEVGKTRPPKIRFKKRAVSMLLMGQLKMVVGMCTLCTAFDFQNSVLML